MIRFLSIIVFITLLYLSAVTLGKYDSGVSLSIWNYTITTSIAVLLALLLFLISLLSLGFRVFVTILSFPFVIIAKIANFKKSSQYNYLMDSYRFLSMNECEKAKKSIKKIDDAFAKKYSDHVNFIKSLVYTQSDEGCYFAKLLPNNGEYKKFVLSKVISKMMSEEKHSQALKVLDDAGLSKSDDSNVRITYLNVFSELGMWKEFESKVTKKDKSFFKEKIGDLYLKGAKYFLEEGEENKAFDYLQEALMLNPISMEAIEIFCSLNNSRSANKNNLPVLESAFAIAPSFEIFELYYQSTSLNAEDVYNKFFHLIDHNKYRDVLLSIAAYLKLFDKVDSLLSCRI